MKQLLYYLILDTKGGQTRGKIIDTIKKKPMNANQLASELNLDYKTIQHHLKILIKNNLLKTFNNDYGTVYFLSDYLEQNINLFNEIWERFGKK